MPCAVATTLTLGEGAAALAGGKGAGTAAIGNAEAQAVKEAATESVRGAAPGRGSAFGPTSGKAVTPAVRQRELVRNAQPNGNVYKCEHCGFETKPPKHMDVDHIVPKTNGGDLSPANMRGLCVGCNRSAQEGWPPKPGSDWATKHPELDLRNK